MTDSLTVQLFLQRSVSVCQIWTERERGVDKLVLETMGGRSNEQAVMYEDMQVPSKWGEGGSADDWSYWTDPAVCRVSLSLSLSLSLCLSLSVVRQVD